MGKKYSDDIRLNDGADFAMTVEGDFTKLYEALGIEVPKKNLYTDELKEACDTVVENLKNINRILKEACDTVVENLKNINRIMDQIMTEAVCKSPLVIRVRKEDIKNEDVLRQNGEQETADLKAACGVVELHNKCFTSPTEFCCGRACKECEYYQDPDVVHKAVNQLLDHAKKSLSRQMVD